MAAAVWLPRIIPGTRLHVGFVLAVLACVGVWVLLYKTPLGYRIRAVGYNAGAAEMSGINAKKLYILAFFIGPNQRTRQGDSAYGNPGEQRSAAAAAGLFPK